MPSLLSIVVPVFNEAGSVEPLYQEIVEALAPLGALEVVFVDDGSTDGSAAVIERLVAEHADVRLVKLRRNFGKAAALSHGFAEARGDLIVTMDGDRQDDPAEIPKLLAKLDQGYDLVSGWKQSRQDPVSKTLPSKFFNWTVRKATGVELHDFNCGLKAYRREVIRHVRVYGELHRYIPVLASDLGFRVAEEKVSHRRRTSGESKYGWRRYARGYLDLLTVLFLGRYRQRPQHLFGGIGTMMVLVGVLIDLYLTIDKLFGHPIGQRPLLLLGTLLISSASSFSRWASWASSSPRLGPATHATTTRWNAWSKRPTSCAPRRCPRRVGRPWSRPRRLRRCPRRRPPSLTTRLVTVCDVPYSPRAHDLLTHEPADRLLRYVRPRLPA